MLEAYNIQERELQGFQKTHQLFLAFAGYTQQALQVQHAKT